TLFDTISTLSRRYKEGFTGHLFFISTRLLFVPTTMFKIIV
ncbi:MAG: hypothetical protein ACI88A_005336, partial [Paraglaciecola sp.]